MKCPRCGKAASTLETRDKDGYVRRRYKCFNDHKFSTIEQVHVFIAGPAVQVPESRYLQLIQQIKTMLSKHERKP